MWCKDRGGRMTKEEAIYRLKNTAWLGSDADRVTTEKAVQMAIEALKEQKTGHRISWKAYYGLDRKSWSDELKCSECGYKWGDKEYKFCPSCGCRMECKEE